MPMLLAGKPFQPDAEFGQQPRQRRCRLRLEMSPSEASRCHSLLPGCVQQLGAAGCQELRLTVSRRCKWSASRLLRLLTPPPLAAVDKWIASLSRVHTLPSSGATMQPGVLLAQAVSRTLYSDMRAPAARLTGPVGRCQYTLQPSAECACGAAAHAAAAPWQPSAAFVADAAPAFLPVCQHMAHDEADPSIVGMAILQEAPPGHGSAMQCRGHVNHVAKLRYKQLRPDGWFMHTCKAGVGTSPARNSCGGIGRSAACKNA
jgi:hypothetical protein